MGHPRLLYGLFEVLDSLGEFLAKVQEGIGFHCLLWTGALKEFPDPKLKLIHRTA